MWMEKLKRSTAAPWQNLGTETLVLQPKAGKAHELNETSTWFWTRLDGQYTVEELFTQFLVDFDCDKDEVRPEIEKHLIELRQQGLIE